MFCYDTGMKEFWETLYLQQDTPWDLGQPAPPFEKLLAVRGQSLVRGKMAVLGCGRGHDAALFARYGFDVTGFDMAPKAIEEAKGLYGHQVRFIQADIFRLDPVYFGQFDWVLEHTCFCAISPSLRRAYAKTVTQLLKPGGGLIGLFWAHGRIGGPPYSTSRNELDQLFSPNFRIQLLEKTPFSVSDRQGQEFLGIFYRKA